MSGLSFMLTQSFAPVLLLSLGDVLKRVWSDYLNHRFQIGNIEVSATTLVEAILIFTVAVLASRAISRLIERRIADRHYIDAGLRYTVVRLIHYLILVLGVLFALKIGFSLDLTSIAVLFTALSVGIGFGLQYIASDIASGFILLFERPIRVGDRVTIGDDEGDIHSINLRTTVVMTNDRIAVIVPNSALVRDRVVNWSYGDPRARLAIPVSVSTKSDVELVTKTLERAAEEVSDILTQPQPKVQFLKFGDSSLDFRLLVWTNKPRAHVQIKSDVNYRIEKLFREAGIQISSPQVDIRVIDGELRVDGNVDRLPRTEVDAE
ncbi:MAG TPA: mechanosensitive ion channel domain-containing protein [Pyrinomonadaceae bacterium]|nr:mechanosensitive ion channel domain-containing protein [Pyrinomonadaceae bacterium]